MKFKNYQISKNEMASIQGATSTTLYKQVGLTEAGTCETEYEDLNSNGELDKDEVEAGGTEMGCGNN